ncbi:FadR/GntR family transcriptional regulator [Kineococcus sp. DHX-1]|uniref:FadR/GntR family transcriptional regulator n=1 Tax=Kineococcus sp. DHX-1 TaxID=3349638 RepID=UPI0036D34CF9
MTAVDDAFHGLRRMIGTGRLAAGQKFPPEAELCRELGVSRGSVREAVRMLAALGVVESRHGSGVYVSALRAADLVGTLQLTVDLLPLEGLLELYELRRVLEAHAAGLAAARGDDRLHEELDRLCAAMEATTDVEESAALDAEFHTAIARAGGNPTLVAFLGVLRTRSRSYQMFGLPAGPTIREVSNAAHRAITAAVAARDPAAAATAAGAHVAQTEAWLTQYQPDPSP